MSQIEDKFTQIVAYIKDKSNPKGKAPSMAQKLKMYGLFKRINKGEAKGNLNLSRISLFTI